MAVIALSLCASRDGQGGRGGGAHAATDGQKLRACVGQRRGMPRDAPLRRAQLWRAQRRTANAQPLPVCGALHPILRTSRAYRGAKGCLLAPQKRAKRAGGGCALARARVHRRVLRTPPVPRSHLRFDLYSPASTMASLHFSLSETGPETGVHGRQPSRPLCVAYAAAAAAGAAVARAATAAARRASIILRAAPAGAPPTARREARRARRVPFVPSSGDKLAFLPTSDDAQPSAERRGPRAGAARRTLSRAEPTCTGWRITLPAAHPTRAWTGRRPPPPVPSPGPEAARLPFPRCC